MNHIKFQLKKGNPLIYSINIQNIRLSMITVGYKNLNKVFAPHVIPMVEEATIMLRRSHCGERASGRGLALITERMVATTTFNASHQTSWLHLCGEDL